MKKLKAAVIGVGNISPMHIGGYLARPDVELYAFCDLNEALLNRRGKEYGVKKLYTDYRELLALPEIDLVSVCTWNSCHAEIAIAALEAGKHVLCEKPMAMNEEQALSMQRAAEKSGKVLQIGFVRRFGRNAEAFCAFRDHGDLGELYFARAACIRRNGNPGGWFKDRSRSGGGPLIDLGVHFIDLVRYLMNGPLPVSVYGATFRKLGDRRHLKSTGGYRSAGASETSDEICDVEDLAVATIRFDNGAVLELQMSFSLNAGRDETRVELFGTKGGADLSDGFRLHTEANGYLTDVDLAAESGFDFENSFRAEVSAFVDAAKGIAPVRATAEDGVVVMRILDAIYRSAETHHEVIL